MHHLWQWPSLEQSTAVKVGNTVQMHMQFKIPPPLSLGGVMVGHYVVLAVLLESVRLFVYHYLSSTVTSPGPPPGNDCSDPGDLVYMCVLGATGERFATLHRSFYEFMQACMFRENEATSGAEWILFFVCVDPPQRSGEH